MTAQMSALKEENLQLKAMLLAVIIKVGAEVDAEVGTDDKGDDYQAKKPEDKITQWKLNRKGGKADPDKPPHPPEPDPSTVQNPIPQDQDPDVELSTLK
ncbi:hypothetical protein TrLO_g5548 [Triparma laevis f. longispina]|uniref:Uncharacterized protein n=1 Tax=Triparma laevis f. longispina TaxID=1714387 RepID=A0A9W7C5D9_9STRA|nr:hypothetical protein TrLO_g5548 [Triparma laevis f. longispina]